MDEFAAAAAALAELIALNDREATLNNIFFCNCIKLLIWLSISNLLPLSYYKSFYHGSIEGSAPQNIYTPSPEIQWNW